MTDTPLLIIKENINCDDFLNKDGFNFLTRRVNYKSLTNFPIRVVDERLYGKALFSHNKIDSNTYKTDRIMADFVNFLKSSHSDINILHHDYSYTTAQREHKSVQRKVCFIINAFLVFPIKHFEKTLQKDIDRKVFKINFIEALQENIFFQDHFSRRLFPKPICRLL